MRERLLFLPRPSPGTGVWMQNARWDLIVAGAGTSGIAAAVGVGGLPRRARLAVITASAQELADRVVREGGSTGQMPTRGSHMKTYVNTELVEHVALLLLEEAGGEEPGGDGAMQAMTLMFPGNVDLARVVEVICEGARTNHEAHGSTRVMAGGMAMGQAAGTVAALAARGGVSKRQVHVRDRQGQLRAAGAIVAPDA